MNVMNLADPDLELIDPTPNVHALFLQFDKTFFWEKLASRTVVRWSKRMYSCAGTCSYDRGGLCDIALSEPLLKLRPRKDLIETLLHEMIHAFLFITCRDQDRDGHGPNFKAHMFRINKAAGLNISIYHDFHDEVILYQTHWWRCDGVCQSIRPHFGIVRRTANRAPGPKEYWWKAHQRKCGGNFIKIKEPEALGKSKKENKTNNGDITKYIGINNNKIVKIDKPTVSKPVLKDSNLIKPKLSNNNLVVSKKNNIIFNPQIPKAKDKGRVDMKQTSDVVMTVRSVWANKVLSPSMSPSNISQIPNKRDNSVLQSSTSDTFKSPPKKLMKIDDYFKITTSNLLKDLYGQDFNITQSNNKLIPVPVKKDENLVNCPICDVHVRNNEINRHLDECLNNNSTDNISTNNIDNSVIPSNSIQNKIQQDVVIDLTNISLETSMNEKSMTKTNGNTIEIIEDKDTFEDMGSFDNIILDTKQEKVLSASVKVKHNCPCCGMATESLEEHLDECLAFFDNNTTIPDEGPSTSFDDSEDIHDESLTLNATGTMSPCPCCMKMVEMTNMNDHLDTCLGLSFSENFDDT